MAAMHLLLVPGCIAMSAVTLISVTVATIQRAIPTGKDLNVNSIMSI